ncbi:MAG: oligosaccharide flippase family protein [Deltaproteobacteria bacterium]|nr:oligosaccharide flippase family protein [Deltaproteobacteria bacterium]
MRDILKAFFKTGLGSAASILLNMFSSKIIAVVLGPSGAGLYSLLRQIIQTASAGGTLGGPTPIVQGIAVREGLEKDRYLATVFWLFAAGGIAAAAIFVLFAPWISAVVFEAGDAKTVSLVRWTAVPVALTALSVFVNGLLNGFRAIGRLALVQIAVAAAAAIMVYPVSKFVEQGYTVAFIWLLGISSLAGSLLGLWMAYREGWLKPIVSGGFGLDMASLRDFFRFAGAVFAASLVSTGALLAIRVFITRHEGLAGAGIFNVAWSLSMVYMMLILQSFGTYYLPALSGIVDKEERLRLMNNMLRFSLLFAVPLVVGVIALKPLVVNILYTKEFMPSLDIVRWMLLGDYLKVASWVLGMTILAYADVKVLLWKEVLWWAALLGLGAAAIVYFKTTEGVGFVYFILYACNLAYLLYYAKKRHGFMPSARIIAVWCGGLLIIAAASWHTWSSRAVNLRASAAWICLALAYSWMTLNKGEKNKLVSILLRGKGF